MLHHDIPNFQNKSSLILSFLFLGTTYIDFQVEHDLDIIISVLMSFTGYIMCIYIFGKLSVTFITSATSVLVLTWS